MDRKIFEIGDKVSTPFGVGEVWKITIETVHVKHVNDKETLFSKYHYNPYHHMQTSVERISKVNI